MWGNDVYGDCVTAEEFFKMAAWSVMQGYPETLFSYNQAVTWATQYGYLNGATITGPMQTMAQHGASLPPTYNDGPYQSVDWTDYATLCAAIYHGGSVKLGVDGDPLESIVGSTSGWFASSMSGSQEDHCIGACGFGTVQECYGILGVPMPAAATAYASQNAVILFTWNTLGVAVYMAAMVPITGEAWVRIPGTVQQPAPSPTPTPTPPAPTPTPSPTPPPSPTPTPTPSPTPPLVYDIGIEYGSKTIVAPGWSLRKQHSEGPITAYRSAKQIEAPAGWTLEE